MQKPSISTIRDTLFISESPEKRTRLLALIGILLAVGILTLELTRIMPANTVKHVTDVIILILLVMLYIQPKNTWYLAVIGIGECVVNIYYGGHILGFLYFTFGLAILLRDGFFRTGRVWKLGIFTGILVVVTLSQLWNFDLKRFSISVVNIVTACVLMFGFLYLFKDTLRKFLESKPVLDLSKLAFSERQIACLKGCIEGKKIKDIAQELIVSESVVKKELIAIYGALGVSDFRDLMHRLETSAIKFPQDPQ